jgi:DNA-binding NtrC family response regulator
MATAIASPALTYPHAVTANNPALLHFLVVDDDRIVREACREAAGILGYRATAVESIEQALWLAQSTPIDLVLLGMKSEAITRNVLRDMKRRRPNIEVIVMTSQGTVESAVEAMKAGALDYIAKPFGLADLKNVLTAAASHLRTRAESRAALEENRSARGFAGMIGQSPAMERLYRMVAKAAQTAHPVLITGESGTGKERVARAIHDSGPNRGKPFVPIDCGSLAPTLIESELFGYEKAAFTGAVRPRQGLLAIAEGGTVFLDEVGELALDLQSKLLRALQEHEIRPVGSTKTVPINVRILAATNRDLEKEVSQGTFRRDLYFRLDVLRLRIPPLRERRPDIRLLVAAFLDRMSRTSGRTYDVSTEARDALLAHDWPGNVRELENCIARCCALNSGPTIHVTDLPSSITKSLAEQSGSSATAIVPMARLERQAILDAIEQLNGDKLTAAKLLGIGKTTLYRKLKEYSGAEDLGK